MMYAINLKTVLKSVSILGFLTAFQISPAMANTHEESECAKHIQDKIAWDSNGHTKWEQKNINDLCQGSTKPTQPGECFNKVMNGHVKWGDGDKWEWQNAIHLCSGTSDSEKTISCFQSRIHAGTAWEEAILQCQLKTSSHKNSNTVNME
ncbi:MAG: hypothetical protein QX193_03190 [Methylococcales bacterium]